MKKIEIRNGYVQCPEEWVVLEAIGLAKECEHAGVVYVNTEANKNEQCFIFFSKECIHKLSNDNVRAVLDSCKEEYPALCPLIEEGMLVYPPRIRIYELLAKGEGEVIGYNSVDKQTYPFDAMVVID